MGLECRKHSGGRWEFTLAAGLQLVSGEKLFVEKWGDRSSNRNQRRDKERFAERREDTTQGENQPDKLDGNCLLASEGRLLVRYGSGLQEVDGN